MQSNPGSLDILPEEYKATNDLLAKLSSGLNLIRNENNRLETLLITFLITALPSSAGKLREVPPTEISDFLRYHPEVVEALQTAIETGRYDRIFSLPALRLDTPDAHEDIDVLGEQTGSVLETAWRRPYQGKYDMIMLNNLNSIARNRQGSFYPSAVALIQSSGTGKSRMVDQLAKRVFTIPLNLRAECCASNHPPPSCSLAEPYPPPDVEIREYLCKRVKTVEFGLHRTNLFFVHLFSQVADEVAKIFVPGRRPQDLEELAKLWRAHLSTNDNRSELYKSVIAACGSGQASDVKMVDDSLVKLLRTLVRTAVLPKKCDIKVMLYFDEAHELRHPVDRDKDGKTLYDVVWSSLNIFSNRPLFTVFLSTHPCVPTLDPSTEVPSSARQVIIKKLQPPITETPFDCAPDFPLHPDQSKLEDLGKLSFLARFGRPLFWAILGRNEGDEKLLSETMNLARTKLVNSPNANMSPHSNTAMLAVLDVLITIDYDRRQESTHQLELELVANHMRVAFSIPQHRLYIHSGYPSEPFLAEAASRQMNHYLQSTPGIMVEILKKNLEKGLVDLGQKGEVVMRLLLRMAYMDSITAEQPVDEPNFSKGCGFLQLLKSLFPDNLHDAILQSTPDNIFDSSRTLADDFQNAVVRFTHFVRATDSSVLQTDAMVSAFMRGAAFICHNSQTDVDLVIPILLDRHHALEESSMSALLIQVQRRKQAGSANAYVINEKTPHIFPTLKDSRPYVTLVAELGIDVSENQTPVLLNTSGLHTSRRRQHPAHPRYGIRAYGCNSATWKVIPDGQRDLYKQILGTDHLLDDHPRQDEESLTATRRMMPFWSQDGAWFSDQVGSGMHESAMDEDEDEDEPIPPVTT